MSQSADQQEAVRPGGTDAARHEGIFTAYTEQRRPRFRLRYLLYPVAALFILALGFWTVSFQQAATPIRVETNWGLRTVYRGMSPQEVQSLLGQPTSKERRGSQECYEYGRPSLTEATFTLHVVCYEDGKLREVSQKRYNSWVVTPDGAISPAPLESEELAPPAPAPAPASTSKPGLAGQNTL